MSAFPEDPSSSEIETLEARRIIGSSNTQSWPCLTVLYHPELQRVGEQSFISQLLTGQPLKLSRVSPRFAHPGSHDSRPLRDPYLSRQPVYITMCGDKSIQIAPSPSVSLRVGDQQVEVGEPYTVNASALQDGVLLTLSRRVILLLHTISLGERHPCWGLVGESSGIYQVLRQIAQVADLDVPVLIRGETGVGKERVAQAIHQSSNRSQKPCISVNMAAISTGTAASELFGHVKGAFTGAVKRKDGFFTRADGGTLFLDEIGETPGDIQGMLLRTLAESTVIPVGGSDERTVDVRIIAATDANIEAGGLDGTFRAALLHRLAGYEIRIPPLRERREDIPRLAVHFLETELKKIGETWRLIPQSMSRKLWFPPKLMLDLYRSDWPGNIRHLGNVIRQLVISSRGMEVLQVDNTVKRLFTSTGPVPKPRKKRATGSGKTTMTPEGAAAAEADADMLYEALVANGYEVAPAALKLGIPRSSFYERLKKDPRFRVAKDILRAEIEQALSLSDGDTQEAARHLRISRRALLIRMRDLDIPA